MKKNFVLTISAIILLVFSIFLIFTTNRAIAESAPSHPKEYAQSRYFQKTSWKVTDDSLTDLLDDGWKLISQSSYRMATVTTGGVNAFDETAFVYTLSKNNKYVTCSLYNPSVREGATSNCRLLN